MKRIDLTGQKFGKLTVIEYAETRNNRACWKCKCDCGNITIVRSGELKSGNTKSCGCMSSRYTPKFIDLTGHRFGRLTVIKRADDYISPNGVKLVRWFCQCDCGGTKITTSSMLKSGHTKSCGCYMREQSSINGKKTKKHGFDGTRICRIYRGMKSRCYNKDMINYKDYGGRGIKICDEWLGEEGFIHFKDWAFANGYTEELTIDRIDVNGNYEPDNCRWATYKEQAYNKRDTVYLTLNEETHNIYEWSKILNMSINTIRTRIYKGLSDEDVLRKPIRSTKTQGKGEK